MHNLLVGAVTDVAVSGDVIATSLSSVTKSVLANLNQIAPEAMGIMAFFLVWKCGIKFYKTITRS